MVTLFFFHKLLPSLIYFFIGISLSLSHAGSSKKSNPPCIVIVSCCVGLLLMSLLMVVGVWSIGNLAMVCGFHSRIWCEVERER